MAHMVVQVYWRACLVPGKGYFMSSPKPKGFEVPAIRVPSLQESCFVLSVSLDVVVGAWCSKFGLRA